MVYDYGGNKMTDESIFDSVKEPQEKQIGGSHYKSFHIQPYEFISKNDLSFFQGNVIKYVCRYLNKNGIEDLNKIIHYCELEKKKLKDMKGKNLYYQTNKGKSFKVNLFNAAMMYDDWCKKKRVLQEREEKQIQEYLGDNLFNRSKNW